MDDLTAEKLGTRRVVASISGGKDSAALSLHLRELGIDHDRVFLDTGWEHRDTYEYLRGELTRVLGPIHEVRPRMPDIDLAAIIRPRIRNAVLSGNAMVALVLSKGMLPSRVIRFCTEQLKVVPMQGYLNALADDGLDLVNAVGIRHEESAARAAMTEWEWSDGFDCEVWRPLIHWTEQQVIEIHARHDLLPNPLYLAGATRVGCWPCIYARKSEIALLGHDAERVALIRDLEAELTERARARAEAKGEALRWERTWFQQGSGRAKGELWPIDKAIEWSRTARGGRQLQMFAADPADAGCMRWGLCETQSGPNK